MGSGRQHLLLALVLSLGPLTCRQKDDSKKAVRAEPSEEPLAKVPPGVPEARPWFAGRFRGSIPLEELPRAPERQKRKARTGEEPAESKPIAAGSAELTITVDDGGVAHIVLTGSLEQQTTAVLEENELRARFVPTPDLLTSGAISLRRSGESFEGILSLLDPSRTRPLRGRIEPQALRKDP